MSLSEARKIDLDRDCSALPWFLKMEDVYELSKTTYSTVSSWPIICLYARTGEKLTDVVVSSSSVLLGGKDILGVKFPENYSRASLCESFDKAAVSNLRKLDCALEDPMEDIFDKVQDVYECTGTWCQCMVQDVPAAIVNSKLVRSTAQIPISVSNSVLGGFEWVQMCASSVLAATPFFSKASPATSCTTVSESVREKNNGSMSGFSTPENITDRTNCHDINDSEQEESLSSDDDDDIVLEPEGLNPKDLVQLLESLGKVH